MRVSALLALALVASLAHATDPLHGSFTHTPPRTATPTRITYTTRTFAHTGDSSSFLEGPAILTHRGTQTLLASDVTRNKIVHVELTDSSPETSEQVRPLVPYFEQSGRANGMSVDADGRLYVCQGGGPGGRRRVVRVPLLQGGEDAPESERVGNTDSGGMGADFDLFEDDASAGFGAAPHLEHHFGQLDDAHVVEVLADDYQGAALNSPNDVIVDARHQLMYFTDPRYGARDDMKQERECVFRVDLVHGGVECIVDYLHRPNGLALSNDYSELYVVDNDNSLYDEHGTLIPTPDAAEVREDDDGHDDTPHGEPDGMEEDDDEHLNSVHHDVEHDEVEDHHEHVPEEGRAEALGGVMGAVKRTVVALALDDMGRPQARRPPRVLHDFGHGRGGDGACVSPRTDLLFVAGGLQSLKLATPAEDLSSPAALYVFDTKNARLVHVIRIPDDHLVTNCVFAPSNYVDPDDEEYEHPDEPVSEEVIYVTAGQTVYEVRLQLSDVDEAPEHTEL